jgi:electron transfer flavoprotein alpha subunit
MTATTIPGGSPTMIAVVPVRHGTLPVGGGEAVAECGGRALLVGSGVLDAAGALPASATVTALEVGRFAPAAWARLLAGRLADEPVLVLPGSPDGRDLAPRLAHALGRPLLAGAVEVCPQGATVARLGGRQLRRIQAGEPFVSTLQPGVRGVEWPADLGPEVAVERVEVAEQGDAVVLDELPADPATMDLAEAPRIVGGGAGLGAADEFVRLAAVATSLGASMGGTRVVMDWGWIPFERQIGTTGVIVDPELYLAFGISGAVQHTAGLGQPDHVISVNTDPHCPMMALADLAIVADAPATLAALARLLGTEP